jgi:anti-sigma factor ChrR (cupin superfamily)
MDLYRIRFEPTRHRGLSICYLHRDENGGGAVFIRMEPGCGYPAHRHRGAEQLVVLQGGYRDERGEHREGDYVRYEDGSAHWPVALEGETACVLFATVERGIERLQ